MEEQKSQMGCKEIDKLAHEIAENPSDPSESAESRNNRLVELLGERNLLASTAAYIFDAIGRIRAKEFYMKILFDAGYDSSIDYGFLEYMKKYRRA